MYEKKETIDKWSCQKGYFGEQKCVFISSEE